MDNLKEKKLQISYPCTWIYKIIGVDQKDMQSAVAEIIQDRSYSITFSRSSETSKYHCFNVAVTVESESHRQTIYESLKAHQSIKLVL